MQAIQVKYHSTACKSNVYEDILEISDHQTSQSLYVPEKALPAATKHAEQEQDMMGEKKGGNILKTCVCILILVFALAVLAEYPYSPSPVVLCDAWYPGLTDTHPTDVAQTMNCPL